MPPALTEKEFLRGMLLEKTKTRGDRALHR
jgi:hypothetical protein